jgi:hypothetical protein
VEAFTMAAGSTGADSTVEAFTVARGSTVGEAFTVEEASTAAVAGTAAAGMAAETPRSSPATSVGGRFDRKESSFDPNA